MIYVIARASAGGWRAISPDPGRLLGGLDRDGQATFFLSPVFPASQVMERTTSYRVVA